MRTLSLHCELENKKIQIDDIHLKSFDYILETITNFYWKSINISREYYDENEDLKIRNIKSKNIRNITFYMSDDLIACMFKNKDELKEYIQDHVNDFIKEHKYEIKNKKSLIDLKLEKSLLHKIYRLDSDDFDNICDFIHKFCNIRNFDKNHIDDYICDMNTFEKYLIKKIIEDYYRDIHNKEI